MSKGYTTIQSQTWISSRNAASPATGARSQPVQNCRKARFSSRGRDCNKDLAAQHSSGQDEQQQHQARGATAATQAVLSNGSVKLSHLQQTHAEDVNIMLLYD